MNALDETILAKCTQVQSAKVSDLLEDGWEIVSFDGLKRVQIRKDGHSSKWVLPDGRVDLG